MKLGKKLAQPKPKDIPFSVARAPGAVLREAPVGFGHYKTVTQWGMLGNDQYGDCVWAGGAHETILVNQMNGRTVGFTTQDVLADYSAVTGFSPSDPNSDVGTDVHQALDYRRQTGILDASGARHKIGAYVSLEPGNFHELLEALYAFDFVALGFEVPAYAITQFDQGRAWMYEPTGDGTIEGGHYVPVVGRPHAWTLEVVTWGRVQPMGRRFFEWFCDEAYGVLTLETLSGEGRTPEGLSLNNLQAALAAL